jgi:outer membrane PBP1 activator LpoA protein
MNRVNTLLALGRTLKQAAEDHQWAEVQRVDADIATLLASLKGVTPDVPLYQALQAVRQLHQQVMDAAQAQSDVLAQKMALARRNREGASAYATFMDAEDLG